MDKKNYTIEYIKELGSHRTEDNLNLLINLFKQDLPVEIKREIVSSIGRHYDNEKIIEFIEANVFENSIIMEYVYQMFRTCLYKSKSDERFKNLQFRILEFYKNEILNKMQEFYDYKQSDHRINKNKVINPLLLIGDCEKTLLSLPDNCIQLAFTSPPYYNAKIYSDYHSYNEYLQKMKNVFIQCNRVIEDGRFLIVNVSPVITKRPGREFESIRYPIHFDFHKILDESGFYFIDEIIWIKPEPCVKNRIGGYEQTRKALSYKPNCITESILVYRKKCPFLLDKNINEYKVYDKFKDEAIDTTNCWYITPKSNKNHPAVFPEELCRRILKYYSFKGDTVLDPFAGSGTFGKVANAMGRIPVMCELDEDYVKLIKGGKVKYDVRN